MKAVNSTLAILKKALTDAFADKDMRPIIIDSAFPVSETGSTALEADAKKHGDRGIIFIGRAQRTFNRLANGYYDVYDPYVILFYHADKMKGREKADKMQDIARDAMFPFVDIEAEDGGDVSPDRTGLFLSWTRVKSKLNDARYTGSTLTTEQ